MKIYKHDRNTRDIFIETLQKGGVVAHPTDTCFGLAADITNPEAVEKVAYIKKMSLDKPISIMVGDKEMIAKYGEVNETAQQVIDTYMPGPISILLAKSPDVPVLFFPKIPYISLRLPTEEWLTDIVQRFGTPITTTSANITTEQEPYDAQAVFDIFKDEEYQPDIIIDKPSSSTKLRPSTIVKVHGSDIEIIRQGDTKIEI